MHEKAPWAYRVEDRSVEEGEGCRRPVSLLRNGHRIVDGPAVQPRRCAYEQGGEGERCLVYIRWVLEITSMRRKRGKRVMGFGQRQAWRLSPCTLAGIQFRNTAKTSPGTGYFNMRCHVNPLAHAPVFSLPIWNPSSWRVFERPTAGASPCRPAGKLLSPVGNVRRRHALSSSMYWFLHHVNLRLFLRITPTKLRQGQDRAVHGAPDCAASSKAFDQTSYLLCTILAGRPYRYGFRP